MNRDQLLRRIRIALWVVIAGLVFAGATAIPLEWEVDALARTMGVPDEIDGEPSGMIGWLYTVRNGLRATYDRYPWMAYGTDWLAFAHFVIAIAFLGPLRDPVRNLWVIDFGVITCLLTIPWTIVFVPLRGVPLFHIPIDSSFGILCLVPLLLARKWTKELESAQTQGAAS